MELARLAHVSNARRRLTAAAQDRREAGRRPAPRRRVTDPPALPLRLALALLLLVSGASPAAAGDGAAGEVTRRLPPALASAVSLDLASAPGSVGSAAAVRLAGLTGRLAVAAGRHAATARIDGGSASFDAAGGPLRLRLELSRVDLSAFPLFAALAARADLPDLARRPLKGTLDLASDRDRAVAVARLADGPRAIASTVEIAAWGVRGELRLAFRLRSLPPRAYLPRALEGALDTREITFRFDDAGDGRWRIDSETERTLLRAAAARLAGRGRFPSDLASRSSNPALRLAAATLARPGDPVFLDALPDPRDPAASRGEAPPFSLIPFLAAAAEGGPPSRFRAELPGPLAGLYRLDLADEAAPADLERLPADLRLAAAWHAFGAARSRPAAFATHERARRFAALTVAALAERLTGRPDPGRDAADLARERAALVRFARRLASLGLRDAPDAPFDEGTRRRLARLVETPHPF